MSTFGPAYVAGLDARRIKHQHNKIKGLMLDGIWRTLFEISRCLEEPESSVSAQLRHLRKETFGSYRVEKRRRTLAGTWEYRVLPPIPLGQMNLI